MHPSSICYKLIFLILISPTCLFPLLNQADAFHSSDMDHAPLFDRVHFKMMLDDYFNFQTTLLFVLEVKGTTLTVVHAHTSDQPDDIGDDGKPIVDEWYGTTEPLSRVQAGEDLIFYDPVDFHEMGRVSTKSAAQLLSPATDQDSPLAKKADRLFQLFGAGPTCKPTNASDSCLPFDYPSFSRQHYPLQRLRASVYEVELVAAPPVQNRPGAMAAVPYALQIAKTQTKGAIIKNSLFEDSAAFFGRWKSSHSRLENSVFRGNGNPELEMQLLPTFYEGPIHIENITITNCSFEVLHNSTTMDDILDKGPDCCTVQNLVQTGNKVVCFGSSCGSPAPAPPMPPAPPAKPIIGYALLAGVDVTRDDDGAFGSICSNEGLLRQPRLWANPTVMCDLLDCSRFGVNGGSSNPPREPAPNGVDVGYCIKGWVHDKSANSYISRARCGNGVPAKIVAGSCNNPNAQYIVCPDGSGDVMSYGSRAAGKDAAALAQACDSDQECVGFMVDSAGGVKLTYGAANVGKYAGYTSYIRVP